MRVESTAVPVKQAPKRERQGVKKRAKRTNNRADYGRLRIVPLFWSSTGLASTAQVDELLVKTDRLLKRTRDIQEKQETLDTQQKIINKKVNAIIMGLVQVEQAELDQLDADLDAAAASITTRIEALVAAAAAAGTPLPAAELSALREDVAGFQALGTPATEPPPEPTG